MTSHHADPSRQVNLINRVYVPSSSKKSKSVPKASPSSKPQSLSFILSNQRGQFSNHSGDSGSTCNESKPVINELFKRFTRQSTHSPTSSSSITSVSNSSIIHTRNQNQSKQVKYVSSSSSSSPLPPPQLPLALGFISPKNHPNRIESITTSIEYLQSKHLHVEAAESLIDFINEMEAENQLTKLFSACSTKSGSVTSFTSGVGLLKVALKITSFLVNSQDSDQNTFDTTHSLQVLTFTSHLLKQLQLLNESNTTTAAGITHYKTSFLCNLGVYYLKIQQYLAALESFEMAVNNVPNDHNQQPPSVLIQQSIIQNNIAVILSLFGDNVNANVILKKSVATSENIVFKRINAVKNNLASLRLDKSFLSMLSVLIYGYLYCHSVCKTNEAQQPNTFLRNSYSLSKRFLGEDHPLTAKVAVFLNQFSYRKDHDDIIRETFPFQIDPFRVQSDKFLYLTKMAFSPIAAPAATTTLPQPRHGTTATASTQTTATQEQDKPLIISCIPTAQVPSVPSRQQDQSSNQVNNEIQRLKEQINSLQSEINLIKQTPSLIPPPPQISPTSQSQSLLQVQQHLQDTVISDSIDETPSLNAIQLDNCNLSKKSRLLQTRRKSLSSIESDTTTPNKQQQQLQLQLQQQQSSSSLGSPLRTPPLLLKPAPRQPTGYLNIPTSAGDIHSPPYHKIGSPHTISIFAASKNQKDKPQQNPNNPNDNLQKLVKPIDPLPPSLSQPPLLKEKPIQSAIVYKRGASQPPPTLPGTSHQSLAHIGSMGESIITPINISPPPKKAHQQFKRQQSTCISKISDVIVKTLHFDQEFTIKKRINMLNLHTPTAASTPPSCLLKCVIRYNKTNSSQDIVLSYDINHPIIDLTTKQQPPPSQAVVAEQVINIGVFTELLRFISYEDVLPSTMNLDSVTSLYDVCKFFIIPFIGIEWTSRNTPAAVKVVPRASGLFSEFHSMDFLSEKALIQLNHIEGNIFRIIICDAVTTKKNFRIEYEFDDTSFNNLFATIEKDTYHQTNFTDYFDMTQATESSDLGIELVHRTPFNSGMVTVNKRRKLLESKSPEFMLQSVRILNQEAFTQHFTHIIIELERVISQHSLHKSIDSLSQENAHIRVRVYQGLKKAMIIIVDEASPISYKKFPVFSEVVNTTTNGVRILLFNAFESFSPSGQKLKEKGEAQLSSLEIHRMYGVDFCSISDEDKQTIKAMCSYHFNLRVIEKVSNIHTSQSMHANSLTNTANQSIHNILRIPTVSGGEQTILVKSIDGFHYPLNLQIFGSKDIFLGVKVTLYNPGECSEQGIFLTAAHSSWLFTNEALKKKFLNYTVDSLPLSNYFITQIFKHLAVPVILANIQLENTFHAAPSLQSAASLIAMITSYPPHSPSFNPPNLIGAKGLFKDKCNIIRLETLLTPDSFISHFLPQTK